MTADLSTQGVVMTTNGGEGNETSVQVALRSVRVPLHVASFSCFVWFISTILTWFVTFNKAICKKNVFCETSAGVGLCGIVY